MLGRVIAIPKEAKRVFMAATVLVLLMLVLVTPILLGQEDFSAFPKLVLTFKGETAHLLVTSFGGGNHLYSDVHLIVVNTTDWQSVVELRKSPGWAVEAEVSVRELPEFLLNVTIQDQRNATYYFSGLFASSPDPRGGWAVVLTSSASPETPYRIRSEEVEWPHQPFSLVFPRREAPAG